MSRKIGAFTCYGIEYVFDFLGEKRINQKIRELEGKPTMGTTLKDFTYYVPEYSYFSSSGVLHAFNILVTWFHDYEFISFLYQHSKMYNEENYFDSGLLPSKRTEYLSILDLSMNRSSTNKLYCEANKQNPYWNEYHFFYMTLSKILKRLLRENNFIEPLWEESISSYLDNFTLITNRVRVENSPYEKKILSNGFLVDAIHYFKKKGMLEKAKSIGLLNNSFPDVWREVQIDGEK